MKHHHQIQLDDETRFPLPFLVSLVRLLTFSVLLSQLIGWPCVHGMSVHVRTNTCLSILIPFFLFLLHSSQESAGQKAGRSQSKSIFVFCTVLVLRME